MIGKYWKQTYLDKQNVFPSFFVSIRKHYQYQVTSCLDPPALRGALMPHLLMHFLSFVCITHIHIYVYVCHKDVHTHTYIYIYYKDNILLHTHWLKTFMWQQMHAYVLYIFKYKYKQQKCIRSYSARKKSSATTRKSKNWCIFCCT